MVKLKKKYTDIAKQAVRNAGSIHRERRMYFQWVLGNIHRCLELDPSWLESNLPMLFAACSAAKDEIHWYFIHSNGSPPDQVKSKHYNASTYDAAHVPELMAQLQRIYQLLVVQHRVQIQTSLSELILQEERHVHLTSSAFLTCHAASEMDSRVKELALALAQVETLDALGYYTRVVIYALGSDLATDSSFDHTIVPWCWYSTWQRDFVGLIDQMCNLTSIVVGSFRTTFRTLFGLHLSTSSSSENQVCLKLLEILHIQRKEEEELEEEDILAQAQAQNELLAIDLVDQCMTRIRSVFQSHVEQKCGTVTNNQSQLWRWCQSIKKSPEIVVGHIRISMTTCCQNQLIQVFQSLVAKHSKNGHWIKLEREMQSFAALVCLLGATISTLDTDDLMTRVRKLV